jgi:hypothetical protein
MRPAPALPLTPSPSSSLSSSPSSPPTLQPSPASSSGTVAAQPRYAAVGLAHEGTPPSSSVSSGWDALFRTTPAAHSSSSSSSSSSSATSSPAGEGTGSSGGGSSTASLDLPLIRAHHSDTLVPTAMGANAAAVSSSCPTPSSIPASSSSSSASSASVAASASSTDGLCLVCFDTLLDGRATVVMPCCSRELCLSCVSRIVGRRVRQTCPMCQVPFDPSFVEAVGARVRAHARAQKDVKKAALEALGGLFLVGPPPSDGK